MTLQNAFENLAVESKQDAILTELEKKADATETQPVQEQNPITGYATSDNQTNGDQKTKILNINGDTINPATKEDITNVSHGEFIGVIEKEHEETHEGNLFTASHVFRNVTNGSTIYFRIANGATKYAHATYFVTCGGESILNSYSGTTYTNTGTLSPGTNRNSVSTNTPTLNCYYSPTVNTLGTLRADELINGGSGPQSVGATGGSRSETILNFNSDILLAITNISGNTKNFGVVVSWYETTTVEG